jgi:hypothetical protein
LFSRRLARVRRHDRRRQRRLHDRFGRRRASRRGPTDLQLADQLPLLGQLPALGRQFGLLLLQHRFHALQGFLQVLVVGQDGGNGKYRDDCHDTRDNNLAGHGKQFHGIPHRIRSPVLIFTGIGAQ